MRVRHVGVRVDGLATEMRTLAVPRGIEVREIGAGRIATSEGPGVSEDREDSSGDFPRLLLLRGSEREIDVLEREYEGHDRLVVQRPPQWRPVHRDGLVVRALQAGQAQAYENKARSQCAFDAADTIPRGDVPARIFVVDVGRPNHPQLAGRVDYHGTLDPRASYLPHGTGVCGVLAAIANGSGFEGCCDAQIEFHNVYRPDVRSGAMVFDPEIFYQALLSFCHSPSRVLNLSMSTDHDDRVAELIFECVQRANKMIVTAMPSDGDGSTFPASLPTVIAVGGVDDAGDASYSVPRGMRAVISAPASQLDVLAPGGSYRRESGTSFAAPAVSAALWLATLLRPSATPSQLLSLLSRSVEPGALPGTLPDSARGAGRLLVPAMIDGWR